MNECAETETLSGCAIITINEHHEWKPIFRNMYGTRVPHTADKLLCSNNEHLYLYRNIFIFRHFAIMFVMTVLLASLKPKTSRNKTSHAVRKKQKCMFYVIYRLGTKIIHASAMEIRVLELAVWAGQTKQSIKWFQWFCLQHLKSWII